MAFSVATHENSRFGSDPSTENRATTKRKKKVDLRERICNGPGRCSRLASEVRPLLCTFLLKKDFFFLSSKLGNWKQASPK
jgi:hypothetical protein